MNLYKVANCIMKNKPTLSKNWFSFTGITILLIIFLVSALYLTLSFREEHCTSSLDIPPTRPEKCFDTQVEAIYYATDGRIDLPDDATQEEINHALENQ